MSQKLPSRKTPFHKVVNEQSLDKNTSLILWGVILAMTSIGLLIFVLSVKIFKLN